MHTLHTLHTLHTRQTQAVMDSSRFNRLGNNYGSLNHTVRVLGGR
uniref:Uncharacterized protein n=1 Tax=Anguilla anguilla TaxID=7936 RepID=A0A0E9UWU7_ANGAN